MISYLCTKCGYTPKKVLRPKKNVPKEIECPECGETAKRKLGAPGSVSKTVVDNGLQTRATEVSLEIIESVRERSSKGPSREG